MLKNVSLLKDEKDGKATWRLLGPDGLPVDAFAAFANSLLRKHPFNTRKAYCRHLANFFDYLFEVEVALGDAHTGKPLTRALLRRILEAYDEYLVKGDESGNEIAKLVSKTRPSLRHSAQTSALMHAPVRKFLSMSEQLRQELQEDSLLGLTDKVPADEAPIFVGLHTKLNVTREQHHSMTANSMISGVISGGPKFLKSTVLPTISSQVAYEDTRAFPFDQIADFVNAHTTFRDKALHAFYAASGARGHEGLQLLLDDIDVNAGTVALRDPALRANHPSYLFLTPLERDKLSWKGRTTESTLLIEPFASIFFENLEQYLSKEYIPHGLHRFVFQNLRKSKERKEGSPFFLSAHSTRLEAFKAAATSVGLEGAVPGPHSLRHSYGSYLLNYFPRLNGEYGLPVSLVKQLMGHASLKSTLKYARYDKDLIHLELQHANAMVYRGAEHKSIIELKLEALNAQVNKLQLELKGLGNA
jgi:integrase